MKKFLFALAAATISFLITSCDDKTGILYNVNINGCAAGDVVITFPNGGLNLEGDTNLTFVYSNDTTTIDNGVLLSEALVSTNRQVAEFAATVDNEFNVMLKDTELEGSYDVRIHGYAKEPNTGFVIAIDKEFKYPPLE